MARPKSDLPPAAAVRDLLDEENRLAVKVTPGARVEGLEIADGKLFAKVRAKPKAGEANEALLELVAAALGVARSRVVLLRGAGSREKLLGLDP